jgi:response regulator NasT
MPTSSHAERGLSVVVANEHADALRVAERLVADAGHRTVASTTAVPEVDRVVEATGADLVVVAVHREAHHALELVERVNDVGPCPVVLLLDDDDPALIREALDHGLDAYASRATPAALQSAIDLARRRAAELDELGRQVRNLEAGAERRALIERAKGVLMERHDIDERRAYDLLRTEARTNRVTLVKVAEALMQSRTLLPGRPDPDAAS